MGILKDTLVKYKNKILSNSNVVNNLICDNSINDNENNLGNISQSYVESKIHDDLPVWRTLPDTSKQLSEMGILNQSNYVNIANMIGVHKNYFNSHFVNGEYTGNYITLGDGRKMMLPDKMNDILEVVSFIQFMDTSGKTFYKGAYINTMEAICRKVGVEYKNPFTNETLHI